jgi:DNA-binding helix-hairpin-helix protein with protein kinase domain
MAWPLDSLFNSSGEFVGFSMPKVSGPDANVLIGNKDKVLAGYPSLKKTDLIEFCLNFFMTLDYLHQRNVVIGDIKTDNVVLLGGDITKPILVDCDSFQVGEYICPVVSRFYTPPEYFKKSPDSFFRTFDGDIFSAATLAFMVFTYGRRPFDYRIDPSDPNDYSYEQKEVKGMLPYSLDSANETGLHAPNGEAPAIWSHFPSYIKQLFLDSFAACSFGSGKTRPTSSQWVAGLKSYLLAAKSGSLATIDPEFDEPYQQNVIDYSILNIPLVSNKKAQGVGFSMKDAVIRALMNLKEKTATQVLASKAIAALYHDSSFSEGSFAFVLSTNIGVFKRVSVEFKPSFN